MNLKRTVLAAMTMLAMVGTMASSATALTLNFSSVGDANITFDGSADTFVFNNSTVVPTGFDFSIGVVNGQTDGDTDGLLGNIDGTYTIGAISSPVAGIEVAPVSGTGNFSIRDENGVTLSGLLAWTSISTIGQSGAVDAFAVANLSGITYTGLNTDLQAFGSLGSTVLNFTFNPAKSLTDLTTNGVINTTTHSGSVSPVPEPTSLLLLGAGLAGLGILRRKQA